MKLLRNSALLAAASALVFLTGCSSSEFGSSKGDGPSAGAQKSAQEKNKSDEDNADDEKNGKAESDKDGDENDSDSKLDNKDEASAEEYQADESTKGCSLPAEVKAKFGDQGGKLGFGLGDWGGSGAAELELTNLSLTDCSWFKSFKDSDAVYIVQYDEKAEGAGLTGEVVQSYAEPFNGKTAVEFAQCLTAAIAAGATCNKVGDL